MHCTDWYVVQKYAIFIDILPNENFETHLLWFIYSQMLFDSIVESIQIDITIIMCFDSIV